jgi:cysteine dioxygenase
MPALARSPKTRAKSRKPAPRASAKRAMDPAIDPAKEFPALAELIGYLQGLTHRADLNVLTEILSTANITLKDIKKAAVFGKKGYRRNCIASSPWFELLVLTWRSGHCTPIHDHRGVSCAFKVIHGVGREIRFEVTESRLICPTNTEHMQPGYVCAAADDAIHQVANMQKPGHDLVTLHIYSPRIKKMHTFDFKTSAGAEVGDVYAR